MPVPAVGAPGLYLEGRDTEPALELTDAVAGFVGLAERGPLHAPQPLRGWGEYRRIFGGFVPWGYLAEAVHGFFLNGGEKCWVVRVAALEDRAAENAGAGCHRVELLRRAAGAPVTDSAGDPTLALEAVNEGAWGNRITYAIDHESPRTLELTSLTRAAAESDSTLEVASVFDFEAGAALELAHAENPFLKRSFTVAAVDPAASTLSLSGPVGASFPRGSAVSGHGFRLRAGDGERRESFEDLSMTPEHPRYFVRVINGEPEAGGDDYTARQKRGHSILVRAEHRRDGAGVSRFKPASTGASPRPLRGGGDGFTFASLTLADAAAQPSITLFGKPDGSGNGNGLRARARAFAVRTALAVPAVAGGPMNRLVLERLAGFEPGDVLRLTHPSDATILDDVSIQQVGTANDLILTADLARAYPPGALVTLAGRFDLELFRPSTPPFAEPDERHVNLDLDAAGPRFFADVVGRDSELVCAEPAAAGAGPPVGEGELAGGRDPGEIDSRYYTGYESEGAYFRPAAAAAGQLLGLARLEEVSEVSLVAVPDLGRAVGEDDGGDAEGALAMAQSRLLFHGSKTGERLALLDPPADASLETVAGWPRRFSQLRLTRFGALYYPWIDGLFEGAARRVPPSGLVAGVVARSDRLGGVGRAPANLRVLGAVDLERRLSRAEQHELNPRGINCLRKLEDGQIRLLGARTLSPEPDSRWLSVRRVLLALVKTLSRRLLWAVFEPGDARLYRRIESTLESFLLTLVSRGVTAGNRAGEAFYVRCGEATNPPARVAAGEVLAEIGVALRAPAEFIVLTARRTPESLAIVEEEV